MSEYKFILSSSNICRMLNVLRVQTSIYCYKVYAEHLLEPLLRTIFALSGPRTTILVNSFAVTWEASYILLALEALVTVFIFLSGISCSWAMRSDPQPSMNKCWPCGRAILK